MWLHLWRSVVLVLTTLVLIALLYAVRVLRAIRFVLEGGCL